MDYKLNYLSKTFSKIDKKGIETYVISRIWNKLDNLEVKIVCQQYVERENGYALLDLYFPQINYGIEVDEPHHLNQQEEDNMRKKEVELAVGVEIYRIDCSKPIDDVHKQIDNIVEIIKQKIDDCKRSDKFKPWLGEDYFKPEYYRKEGILRVEDEVILSTSDDICDIFGLKVPKRGFLRAGGVNLNDNTLVWWPNATHKIWANIISGNGETIIEYHKGDKKSDHIKEHLAKEDTRITFYRKRDLFGCNYYRFVGVYKLDKESSLKENMCVWRRVSTEYKL